MTSVLKCNSCNIVIDEMLSYIQNKVSVIDEETLVRICKTSFKCEEIKKSKSLLFDSIPTELRKICRKNKGKEERDLSDIINFFKSAEPSEIPIFVARQLEKLPPLTFDHLDCTKLLKDMLRMQSSIEEIKSNFATVDQLKELKEEFLQIRHDSLPPTSAFKVNTKRGAWLYDSGPAGLSHLPNSTLNESYYMNDNEINKSQYREMQVSAEQKAHDSCTQRRPAVAVSERVVSPSAICIRKTGSLLNDRTKSPAQESSPPRVLNQLTNNIYKNSAVKRGPTLVLPAKETMPKEKDCGGWKTVVYKKRQTHYRYSGKSGIARDLEFNFRAAEKKVPIFITNIHSETMEADIIKYIFSKTKDNVTLEKVSMRSQKGHKAYKFWVPEPKLELYLDENIWPQGVVFRRFVNYKRRNQERIGNNMFNNE